MLELTQLRRELEEINLLLLDLIQQLAAQKVGS